MAELITYYVIAGALIIGAPAIFFLIAFMPALQNTKGRMVGYKDHKTYGDSSIYENTPSDNTKFYLELGGWQWLQLCLQLQVSPSSFCWRTL